MAEYRRGNAVVVDLGGLVAEHGFRERLAFADCDGRELHAIGYVAHRVDRRTCRAAVVIDAYCAVRVELDAGAVEPELFGIRYATNRAHHRFAFHARVAEMHVEHPVRAPLDALERHIEQELDAL